jgi:hypothetical protein
MDQQTKFKKILEALGTLKYQVVVYFTDGTLIGNVKERSTENVLFLNSDLRRGLQNYFDTLTPEEVLEKYNKTALKAELQNIQDIDSKIISFTGTIEKIIDDAYVYLYGPDIILEDDFPSQGKWEIYPSGPGISSNVIFLGSPSQVKFYPSAGTLSGIVSGLNNPPFILPYPLPAQVTFEFKFMVTNFSMSMFMIRTNVANKFVGVTISSTKIEIDNISYNIAHSANQWYTYRIVIDGNLCKVYRNGTLIPKNFTPLIISSGNKFDVDFFAVLSSVAYLEYLNITPGLLLP